MLCAKIKARPSRRYQREHLIQFSNQVTGWTFKKLRFNSRHEKDNFVL